MPDEACNMKILALQLKNETLEREFAVHKTEFNSVRLSMGNIERTLSRIQHSILGAIGFYLMQAIGLTELLKAVLIR